MNRSDFCNSLFWLVVTERDEFTAVASGPWHRGKERKLRAYIFKCKCESERANKTYDVGEAFNSQSLPAVTHFLR